MTFPARHIYPHILLEAVNQDILAFQKLLETFLQIGPAMLTRLEQAAQAGDFSKVTLEMHSLKGTAHLIGALELAQRLELLEIASRRGQPIFGTGPFADMKKEFHNVTSEALATIQSCQTVSSKV